MNEIPSAGSGGAGVVFGFESGSVATGSLAFGAGKVTKYGSPASAGTPLEKEVGFDGNGGPFSKVTIGPCSRDGGPREAGVGSGLFKVIIGSIGLGARYQVSFNASKLTLQ